jgi:hypothetical protein
MPPAKKPFRYGIHSVACSTRTQYNGLLAQLMLAYTSNTVFLTCHPGTRSEVVREIEVVVCWPDGDALTFNYRLKGDIGRLRIPPPRPQRRTDRLWQHTCFETFISVKGSSAYEEFNFSPSGEWAAYSFHRYRDAAPQEDNERPPKITVHNAEDSLVVDATVRLDILQSISPRTVLRLGLAAVVEEDDSVLSYWALKHPSGKPDFHHPDAFALEDEPLEVEAVSQPSRDKR